MILSIVIPTKDRKAILYKSVQEAYKAILNIDAEILIVNDSKNDKILLKSEWKNKVKVLDNPNSGVASARNLGAQNAGADLLVFMDDDMLISTENIITTISLHQNYQNSICINLNWVYPIELQIQNKKTQFGRYLNYYGFDSYKGWCADFDWDEHRIFPAWGITSQYLAISKSDFLRAGGYNEKFPYAGFEDHDFSLKLLKANIQPYIYPLSTLYHNEEDRMEVKVWLERKRRGGETRKVAVELGYVDLHYNYGFLKSFIYKRLLPFQKSLIQLLSIIPNLKFLDFFYFKILNTLLGTALFEGYHKKIIK